MKVKLMQAAHLSGKDYGVGVHEIPDAHLKSKFALKLIKAGYIVEAEDKEIKPLTQAQKQKQLEETLHKAPFQVTLPKATAPTESKKEAPKSEITEEDLKLDQTEEPEDWEPKFEKQEKPKKVKEEKPKAQQAQKNKNRR